MRPLAGLALSDEPEKRQEGSPVFSGIGSRLIAHCSLLLLATGGLVARKNLYHFVIQSAAKNLLPMRFFAAL